MNIKQIKAIYFSATGKTEKVVMSLAKKLADLLCLPLSSIDFTLPENHSSEILSDTEELVVVGVPTYAGRVPNKVLPMIQNYIQGNETPAIAVVTFGNRNFDSSLTELKEELMKNHFHVLAGAAVVCQHSFSDKIGSNRPDQEDERLLEAFAEKCVKKCSEIEDVIQLTTPVIEGHEPVQPYYQPLGLDNQPAKFLKAKPLTNMDLCTQCGICATSCPMGSIDGNDFSLVEGICIKCQACIKKCPVQAKYFEDSAFLSHVAMLERDYSRRAESSFYI